MRGRERQRDEGPHQTHTPTSAHHTSTALPLPSLLSRQVCTFLKPSSAGVHLWSASALSFIGVEAGCWQGGAYGEISTVLWGLGFMVGQMGKPPLCLEHHHDWLSETTDSTTHAYPVGID
jgi:hypothetical protein